MTIPAFGRHALAIWLVLVSVAGAQTPATVPLWSTFLGGAGDDVAAAVRIGPGSLVTVVGTTTSPGMATPGAFQRQLRGVDAFVARIDPRLPPGQQLLWFTYLGGTGQEIALDAQVDALGNTIIVGVTESTDFPTLGGLQPGRNGPSDGFIARLDATGAALQHATCFGGSGDDRICGVALESGGGLAVVGVTESQDLPGTAGTLFPIYRGGNTDAFVARIDPNQQGALQLRWATHLGGPANDGAPYGNLAANGGFGVWWEVRLRRVQVVVLANGDLAVSTWCGAGNNPENNTTPGSLQPVHHPGGSDVLFACIDPTGSSLVHGTYLGGTTVDFPYALAAHPDGGCVIAGATASTDLPCTANAFRTAHAGGLPTAYDGFVAWIDPLHGAGSAQLRYCSYLGGDGGEDLCAAVAVESSGVVTLAGFAAGGGTTAFPTTPGSLAPSAPPNEIRGSIVRLTMRGDGAGDLAYGTLLGNAFSVCNGLALDAHGDAFVVGQTLDFAYPVVNPLQANLAQGLDTTVTHLPMLPGGTHRRDTQLAVPACSAPLHGGVIGAPTIPNPSFAICATNAPAGAAGVLVLGFAPAQIPMPPVTLLVSPFTVVFVTADAHGWCRSSLPIPANVSPVLLHAQWGFVTNSACPGPGWLASSERLELFVF